MVEPDGDLAARTELARGVRPCSRQRRASGNCPAVAWSRERGASAAAWPARSPRASKRASASVSGPRARSSSPYSRRRLPITGALGRGDDPLAVRASVAAAYSQAQRRGLACSLVGEFRVRFSLNGDQCTLMSSVVCRQGNQRSRTRPCRALERRCRSPREAVGRQPERAGATLGGAVHPQQRNCCPSGCCLPDDLQPVIAPREVVRPAVSAGMEQFDRLVGRWIDVVPVVGLEQVAGWAGQRQVVGIGEQLRRGSARDEVVDGEPEVRQLLR